MRWRGKGRSKMPSLALFGRQPDTDVDTDTDTDPMNRLVRCLDETEQVLHGPLQDALAKLARQIGEWE